MGGSFSKVLRNTTLLGKLGLFDEPKVPDLPKVDPPIAMGKPGEPKRKSTTTGSTRSQTIVAGDVTPDNPFKRRTLG